LKNLFQYLLFVATIQQDSPLLDLKDFDGFFAHQTNSSLSFTVRMCNPQWLGNSKHVGLGSVCARARLLNKIWKSKVFFPLCILIRVVLANLNTWNKI
jgi:hypothetical protein